jgi:hypothetical protein
METIVRRRVLIVALSLLLYSNLSATCLLSTDTVKNFVSLNPPTNLFVDPLTLSMTWNKPLISDPDTNYIDFWVYLDENFVGVTEDTTWDLTPLIYGQVYTASVGARYANGMSALDTSMFTCVFLFPPDSLEGDAPDNAAILYWDPHWSSGQ